MLIFKKKKHPEIDFNTKEKHFLAVYFNIKEKIPSIDFCNKEKKLQ